MIEQINNIAEIWWNWMWPMFWQVGLLVVLIGTIDFFIKRWAWPQVRYVLWLFVLVKLVLPPGLTSPASLTSQIQPLAKKAMQSQITSPEKPLQASSIVIPNTMPIEPSKTSPYKDSPDISQATIIHEVTKETVGPKTIKITPVPLALSWRVYGLMVWLVGIVFLSCWLIIRLRRLRRESLKNSGDDLPEWFESLLDQIAQRLKLRRLPEIVLSNKVNSPATFGVFRPVILMPKENISNLSETSAEHILLHELAHIKRGDLIVQGFYMLLQIVYWFNPLLWLIRTHLQGLRELCCDATVAMMLKEKTFSYRETLLETAKQLLTKSVGPGLGLLGLFENSKRLTDRLKWLEKRTWKNRPGRLATIIVLVGVMLCCVLPMAKATKAKTAATGPHPGDGMATGTIVSELKWKPGVNAKSHRIYFGTNTNQLPLLAEVENPSYDELPELEEGTRYYWIVNEVWDDGTIMVGDVWSFTTGKLVGWWKFDETEGLQADDSSSNNNIGTLIGNPQWQPSAGKLGGALVFDGFDDYVDCGKDSSLVITDKITIAAWVKMNDAGNSQFQSFITKGDYTYAIKHHSRNVIEFVIYDDGFWQVAHYPVDSSFNDVWHHVAGTYDGRKLKLYIDGKLEVTTDYIGSIGRGNYNFNIGSNSETRGRFYNGAIDDVRIYDYALCEKEIERLCGVKAIKPHPSNDLTTGLTEMPELSWVSAIGAVSHKVYAGIDPEELKLLGEVTESKFSELTDIQTNRINYWRVDGVLADGSIAKGDVWSFWIPPANAYNPFPADGVEFVELNVELRWGTGFEAKMHTVYVGDNFNDVSNASGGLPQTTSVYVANNLVPGKTYYWRVDEFDAVDTYKGEVWNFKTLPATSVTDPNLVGWWRFDGNANDSSGNGNNGVETGDPTYVKGRIGHAISFDGVSDRIEVNATFADNPELYPAKSISISGWLRTTVPRDALCSVIRHEFHFNPLQTFADSAWSTVFVNRYGSMALRRSNLDWSKINDGKWHHYAATYNNGVHEVWIDSIKDASNNYGQFPLWTGDDRPWVFGGKEDSAPGEEFYPGELDDIRIYDYALSKDEIIALYNGNNEVIKKDEATNAAPKDEIHNAIFEDEPEARALYGKMVETMRSAETLSYTSNYRWESKGREIGRCTYTIWMKKPNYFRVETVNSRGIEGGSLIGDGDYLWIYWPKGRPRFSSEEGENYEPTRSEVYMKEATPLGKHSIGHKTGLLGAGMSMPIIDPSTFHGYTDSLQPYIDWIRGMGTEKVGDEECDVIEVSIMKHQRSWYMWLSKQDYLPRKMKQVVRVAYDIIMYERWNEVTINAEMPTEKFVWSPPEGWRQWRLPSSEERLLKPGQDAPDFELLSVDESKIRLSGYRGNVVWFYIWRAG